MEKMEKKQKKMKVCKKRSDGAQELGMMKSNGRELVGYEMGQNFWQDLIRELHITLITQLDESIKLSMYTIKIEDFILFYN